MVLATHPEVAPSTRFRVDQYRPFLARQGIELAYSFLFDKQEYQAIRSSEGTLLKGTRFLRALARRRKVLRSRLDADLVWIEREIAPALGGVFRSALDGLTVPIVYDFDDAVYLPRPGGHPLLGKLNAPALQTVDLCSRAHTVFAGNSVLADFAEEHSDRVMILPTVINTDRFLPGPDVAWDPRSTPSPGDPPVIGWVGSHSTLPYLLERVEAFRALRRIHAFRLRIVSNRPPPEIHGVDVDYVPWTPESEVSVFHGLSVGVYPVGDDPWTRGKCGFKAIEYLSCGVPCVASPVGVIKDIVVPEETGLWASTDEEWCGAMARMLENPREAALWGSQGRKHVVDRYSVKSVLPRLASALRTAAGRQDELAASEGSACAVSPAS